MNKVLKSSSVLRAFRILILFFFGATVSYFVYNYGLTISSHLFSFISYIINFTISFTGLGFIFLIITCSLSIISFLIFDKISKKQRKKQDGNSYLGYYFHLSKKDGINYIGKQQVPILDGLISFNIYIRTNKSVKGYFYAFAFSTCSLAFFAFSWLFIGKLSSTLPEQPNELKLIFASLLTVSFVSLVLSSVIVILSIIYLPMVEAYLRWKEK